MSKSNPKYNFKILLLGEPAVGKTALVQRFIHSRFSKEYLLTIGVEPYVKKAKIKKTSIAYTIFDVAGQQRFNSLRTMFYRGAKGTFIIFDLTRKKSFDAIESWLNDVKDISPDQEYILVGNKADLEKDRKVTKKKAEKKAEELGFSQYIETSALTGVLVDESFLSMGTALLSKEQKLAKKKKK